MTPSATYRQPVRNGAEITFSSSDVSGSTRAESVPVRCHQLSTAHKVSKHSKAIKKRQLLSNNNHPSFTGSVHDGASTDCVPGRGAFSRQVSPLMQVSLPSQRPASFADQVSAVECHKPEDYQSLLPCKTDNALSSGLGRTRLQLPAYECSFIQDIVKTTVEGKNVHLDGKIRSAPKSKKQFTVQQIARHNQRERERVFKIRCGIEQLGELIPPYYLTKPRSKLSMIQVLTMASSYIRELSSLLEAGSGTDKGSA